MQSTLFTTLTATEEANLSGGNWGGWKPVKPPAKPTTTNNTTNTNNLVNIATIVAPVIVVGGKGDTSVISIPVIDQSGNKIN